MNRLESNNAKMKIKPGEKTGYSKVIINNASEFPASVQIGYDNLGNEFTGERRTKFAATLNNLLFLNELFLEDFHTALCSEIFYC